MSRLVVRPSAELDIRDAADWYEDEEIGLGSQFVMPSTSCSVGKEMSGR